MQINLSGHHVDVTSAMKEYVENKMTRIERHFDHVVDARVLLKVEKQGQIAEATLHVSGHDFHAQSSHSDMYAAIDGMVDKLDRQIRKHKEKITDHHQRDIDRHMPT
ncbi:MAG: ribosome-associated translation inhibitor RaiA [Gammaproteobacteria bacterium]|nr:ribosome-associated translation inhibitor RaiA [Gammaproteobacteria bacterium]NNM01181.1 ribosome-associated translation inhibitor RaiA [Gammaproteobacteria bacterium]